MAGFQKINKKQPIKSPTIINERAERLDRPVRVIYYVEVGNAPQEYVIELVKRVSSELVTSGNEYIVPIRNGKITTDMEFEHEFLNTVRKLCEIKNDEIVLKNGSNEVAVVRTMIKDET